MLKYSEKKKCYYYDSNKIAWQVSGWTWYGFQLVLCETEEEAKEIANEYLVEDRAYMLIESGYVRHYVPASVKHKRVAQRQEEMNRPKLYKGILYSWDDTPIEFIKGTYGEFEQFRKQHMGPGDRLVWWDEQHNKNTIKCELCYNEEFKWYSSYNYSGSSYCGW